jgi:MoaE-MoaD fusion protein
MKSTVSIKYFSVLAQIAEKRNETIELQNGVSVEQLLDLLKKKYPAMGPYISHVRVAVNQNYVSGDFKPSPNDEIALITPVSGG